MTILISLFLLTHLIKGKENEDHFIKNHDFDNPNDRYNQVDDIENQKEFIRNKRKRHRGSRNQFGDYNDYEKRNSNEECDMPHTRRNFAGQCVCEKGYQTTDAYKHGCWKCPRGCHLNAQCEKGGVCKCLSGYQGDGVTSCEIIPPKIKLIEPTEIDIKDLKQDFRVNVTFSYSNYISNEAYCSFDNYYIKTSITKSNIVSCPIPTGAKGKTILRISFNNRDWSQEEIYFTIKDESFDFETAGIYFLIFAIVFAIARAVYVQYKGWSKPGQMSTKTLKLARRRRRGLL